MKLLVTLAVAASLSPAGGQDAMGKLKTLIDTRGTCASLVVESAAVPCGDAAFNLGYRDGQTSIAIKTGDANLVSFLGRPDGRGGIAVTRVTVTHHGQTPVVSSTAVSGRCTADSLRKPRTHVECSAETPLGRRFAASFTGTEDEVSVRDLDR
jgi:hypothetical protein